MMNPAPEGTPRYFAILGEDALKTRSFTQGGQQQQQQQGGDDYDHYGDERMLRYLRATTRAHQRNAQRFLDLLLANSGLYIKIGQVISATAQNLPKEYKEKLKVCMAHAKESAFADVR